MGCKANIDYEKFPKQGERLNAKVRVCFFYKSDRIVNGVIVRDDMEEPFETIIKLDDGRYIRSTECQYS